MNLLQSFVRKAFYCINRHCILRFYGTSCKKYATCSFFAIPQQSRKLWCNQCILYSTESSKKEKVPLLKWLVLGAVFGFGSLYIYRVFAPDEREIKYKTHYYANWKIRMYRSLPLNALSRLSGRIANTHIPVWMRPKVFGAYARVFDCRMDEALVEDLKEYATFSEFFNRKLKPHMRPISDAFLISPVDGVVLHYGKVINGRIEFVKGHDYDITEFLGPLTLKKDPESCLYQMVIYLAPGKYHGFHSPSRFVAQNIIHFPGFLLSVRKSILDRLPDLFCINERVVLNGKWDHGFFSMTAVAATNVGDIVIYKEPNLRTNVRQRWNQSVVTAESTVSHAYRPGEKVGEFRLGSTVVLIFEAHTNIDFAVKAGDELRYGQSLVK